MLSKVLILAVYCLLKITSITSADSDGFNMESTRLSMRSMRRSDIINGKQFVLAIFHQCNWYRAAHICKFNGMELASINSPAEQDAITTLINGSSVDGPYWISGNDLGSVKNWYWLANGNPITYFNWNAGEPNNYLSRDERCLSLTKKVSLYRWNDVPCDKFYSYNFICEIRSSTRATRSDT